MCTVIQATQIQGLPGPLCTELGVSCSKATQREGVVCCAVSSQWVSFPAWFQHPPAVSTERPGSGLCEAGGDRAFGSVLYSSRGPKPGEALGKLGFLFIKLKNV